MKIAACDTFRRMERRSIKAASGSEEEKQRHSSKFRHSHLLFRFFILPHFHLFRVALSDSGFLDSFFPFRFLISRIVGAISVYDVGVVTWRVIYAVLFTCVIRMLFVCVHCPTMILASDSMLISSHANVLLALGLPEQNYLKQSKVCYSLKNKDDHLAEGHDTPTEEVSQGWYASLTCTDSAADGSGISSSPLMPRPHRPYLTLHTFVQQAVHHLNHFPQRKTPAPSRYWSLIHMKSIGQSHVAFVPSRLQGR